VNDRTARVDLSLYAQELRERNRLGECFICELAEDPGERHVVFEDQLAIAFLPRHLTMPGRVILAPREHRTDVVDDFSEAEYVELQRRVYQVGRALSSAFETERLYVFSFGANEGVAHVHWHLAALPPGVPYMEQQFSSVMIENGYLDLSESDHRAIADRIRAALT
jgi:diadenosine tetraphosphate (Ap4A) HIT family hydrolase